MWQFNPWNPYIPQPIISKTSSWWSRERWLKKLSEPVQVQGTIVRIWKQDSIKFWFFYTMNRNFKTSWIGCLSYYSHDFFLKCRIPLPQYQVFYIISGFRQLQNIFKYIMSHADLLNELLHGPQGLILSIKKKKLSLSNPFIYRVFLEDYLIVIFL